MNGAEVVALELAGEHDPHELAGLYVGTVNADPVTTANGKTYRPETLLVVYVEPVPLLYSVRYQLRAVLVHPAGRPSWNHTTGPDGRWWRVRDAAGNLPYPVKRWPPVLEPASSGSST